MAHHLFEKIAAKLSKQEGIEIPPKIHREMEGEFIEYIDGKSLTVRFPVKQKYQNPFGSMQGGMIVAAIDCTYGPLAYLLAPPSVTTHINTTYIRPVTANEEYIDITATVVEMTKRQIHMRADVKNSSGQLLAISHSSNTFIVPVRNNRTRE
jgi:uncharacterized protein (TIGR00369 family)